ncbi:MAG: DUF3298 domain-containing protein [Bacteroidaceae bacterium]|nr:DUF3298 domain-containing protein [Bacteroidaceae bacterium]
MKKYLFILSMAALAFACTDEQGSTNGEQNKLEWGNASLCIEEPIAPKETLCYHIEFKLDTLAGDGQLAKSLSQVLRDSVLCAGEYATIQEAMAALADSMKTEWKAELAEMYDPESDFRETLQYYYTVEGSPVETVGDSILSYQTNIDCYLGGAHGSYVVFYYNFDRKTGKLLNISDVVPADKEMLVMKAMEEQLCKDWEAKDLADLQEKTGITMLGDLYLTNNFLLKGDSITFLFNQYEIAPYAAGLISVTLQRP